jgi:hypothetical protein
MTVIPGTCSSCSNYQQNVCSEPESAFSGRRVWSIACVNCGKYKRRGSADAKVEK